MDVTVSHNSEKNRYEAAVKGQEAGFIEYVPREDGVVELPHTEVDKAYEGQGVGGQLVQQTLDQLRALDKKVVPSCPFVAKWIEKHPDYQDMVAQS